MGATNDHREFWLRALLWKITAEALSSNLCLKAFNRCFQVLGILTLALCFLEAQSEFNDAGKSRCVNIMSWPGVTPRTNWLMLRMPPGQERLGARWARGDGPDQRVREGGGSSERNAPPRERREAEARLS